MILVFNLSILSSIPASSSEHLPIDVENLNRLRSLFSIGVHDIPMLEVEAKRLNSFSSSEDGAASTGGWVACTTDEILKMKKILYDFVVELPEVNRRPDGSRIWPKIIASDGTELRASSRDLQRWRMLHLELQKTLRQYPHRTNRPGDDFGSEEHDEGATLLQNYVRGSDEDNEATCDDSLIEPMTWSRLAYSGFMWWASAGETDETSDEQFQRDSELLGDLTDYITPNTYAVPIDDSEDEDSGATESSQNAGLHTAIIAYFHRLTSCIVSTLSENIELTGIYEDQHDSTNGQVKELFLGSEELTQMGLDAWSPADQNFAKDIVKLYWGVNANVRGAGLECCGVRIY